MKNLIILSSSLLLIVVTLAPAATPYEYEPNQIIIKYRHTVADTIEEQIKAKILPGQFKLSNSLDEVNARHRLKAIKPLLKNFKEERQKIDALQRKDKFILAKKEKHILRRLKRAPKDAKVPDLERIYKIEVDLEDGQSLQDVVEDYKNDSDVEYAELNYVVSICKTPNDPLYPIQWPLNNIGQPYPESGRYNSPPGTPDADIDAPEGWDIHTGSSDIIVALLDTGTDYDHRDLAANMWRNAGEIPGNNIDDDGNGFVDDIYGYDFSNDDHDPKDDNGHGTHCAGIIAAVGNNGLDITGVCFNARIMALKFLDDQGNGYIDDAADAFYYAVQNGADVTSNSWGDDSPSDLLEEVVDYVHSQGVMTIAAAGNNNDTFPHYPAFYDNAISVAATNSNDERAPFSTYGHWVDMAAPGVDILSLRAGGTSMGDPFNDYTTIASGTSMACPHVTGACALLLSIYPELSISRLKHHLLYSVDIIAPPGDYPAGRLNIFNGMKLLSSKGNISFDSDFYSSDSIIAIRLYDLDLKDNAAQQVTVDTNGGDFETITLLEDADIPWFFTGTIPISSDPVITEDEIIQASHGQTITVTYFDANSASGNPAVATDTATADFQHPVIFNVHVGLQTQQTRILFETDEPATSRVQGGTSCAEPYTMDANNPSLTTSHTLTLTDISPQTEYFFIVKAADAAGNETVDNNDGSCFTFTTAGTSEVYVPADIDTIQEAIDVSWNGGTVLVADGTYEGEGNRDIDFEGKAITVRSINGPENCIIDCGGTEDEFHRGFDFHSGEDNSSVLDGFTIENGYAVLGAGIRCYKSNPTITNCIFKNNSATFSSGAGGGMYNFDSDPEVRDCTFIGNSAGEGAGIYCASANPTISNCIITDNSCGVAGGGIYCYDSTTIIANCRITDNTSDGFYGGGIYSENSNPVIISSLISGNRGIGYPGGITLWNSEAAIINCTIASNLGGSRCGGGMYNYASNSTINNCIFWGNGTKQICLSGGNVSVTNSNIEGGWSGEGNIDTDPCFVDAGFWDENDTWFEGDYHILEDSLCINAGDPNYIPEPNETDLDGNPRIFDDRIDMGAYEFLPPIAAQMKYTPQTLNCKSIGNWVKAHITLPQGFSANDVDVNTPAICEPMGIESDYIKVVGNNDGSVGLEITFDRQTFCDSLTDDGDLEIEVIGSLTTGQLFYASDTIKIK